MPTTSRSSVILGVDIGGTFTDFVLVKDGSISIHKRLTTSDDPARALLEGIAELNLDLRAEIVHGSTIATNALLERQGARTALITTRGFADVIEIGRQNRPDLYALSPHKPEPLVPPEWRFEVTERLTADGTIIIPLDASSLISLNQTMAEAGIESVAVCLLFSFLDPTHEQLIRNALGSRIPISLSSDLLPEYREYERTSTTVINAYVTPVMDRYLSRLDSELKGRRLRIMQSNGGVITAENARREAARTVLSGPAGGAVGAFYTAQEAGFDHIISFDMGGTSTDVALFPGEITRTREASIGGMPMRLPVVDIHTVGAGGGSIARIDRGGALNVGPESAGASPGPACYGVGDLPTTSDANLVLGRLHSDYFLGGEMRLYPERARAALEHLAIAMEAVTPEEIAWGVIQVANAAMIRAIRTVSVERGYDPRDFTLVAFGGAGPLHACALAEALGIARIFIPNTPGVLSALGMTLADRVKDSSQNVLSQNIVPDLPTLDTIFASQEANAQHELAAEGIEPSAITLERALDLRYRGQSYELTIEQPLNGDWYSAFHEAHYQRYGHRHDKAAIEIVNARLKAVGNTIKPSLRQLETVGSDASDAQIGTAKVWFSAHSSTETLTYDRNRLQAGNQLNGPTVIFQPDTTIIIEFGWQGIVDVWGNLVLTR